MLVENDGRKPVRSLDIIGSFWDFDDEGKIDVALRQSAAEWMGFAFSRRQTDKTAAVVDLVPKLKKKDLHTRHRWTVTKEDVDRIAADLWPGIRGPAPDVATVKGRAPKKPPLTYEARHALTEIGISVGRFTYEIQGLNEPSLKGLEFEVIRTADFEDEAVWRGIAEQAKQQRAIRSAYRTGKGEWYAMVDAYRAEEPHVEAIVMTAHEKCSTREKAIEAGKRLIGEKADWLGSETRIEARIYSGLEWSPSED